MVVVEVGTEVVGTIDRGGGSGTNAASGAKVSAVANSGCGAVGEERRRPLGSSVQDGLVPAGVSSAPCGFSFGSFGLLSTS